MADFNLFSTKTDVKKLLFSTDKFKFNEQGSNDSWQDLPGVTPTSLLASIADNQYIHDSSLSSLTDNRNENGWETLDDYSTIPKSYGYNYEHNLTKPSGRCRLDRRGHWLLLPPSLHHPSENVQEKKRSSNNSNSEQIFPDSCESLTVSVDLHVPTDELMTDNDGDNDDDRHNTNGRQNATTDDARNKSR